MTQAGMRRETGALFAGHGTGQQARMELMLTLGVHGDDVEAIRQVVEAGRYEH